MWLQVFMNCLLPLKSVLCAVRSHNCRRRWAMRKLSKVPREIIAYRSCAGRGRQDQIQSAALLQETVLCLFTVVNVLCSIAKGGNKTTKQRKRNPNRNRTNRDEMSRDGDGERAIDMVEMKSAHGQTIKIITGSCGQWKRHGKGKEKGKEGGWERKRKREREKEKAKGMANWLERAKQWPYLNVSCLALTGLLFPVVVVVVVIPAHHTLWPFLNLTDTSRQFQVSSPVLTSLPFSDSLSLSLEECLIKYDCIVQKSREIAALRASVDICSSGSRSRSRNRSRSWRRRLLKGAFAV